MGIEVPVFTGVDVRPWISWMERYFARCDDITELQKLAMAYGFIEGDALLWYSQREFETWKELRNTLLMKYGDDSDPEHYWLLAEQDRLMRRSRASVIQKETTSLKPEETESSMRRTEACCMTESMEKKEIEDDAILQNEVIGQNQLIQHNDSFLHQPRLISETNSSEAMDSILETDFVHQKEAIIYPQVSVSFLEPSLSICSDSLVVFEEFRSAIVRNNQFQAQTGIVFDAVQPDHGFDVWIVPNGAAFGEMSTCVKSTPTAHRVFDSMSRHNKLIQTNMKQNKCKKSWKFKFKHSPSRRFLIQNQLWFMAIVEAHADALLMGRYSLLKNRKTRFSKSRRFKFKHKVEKRTKRRVKSEPKQVDTIKIWDIKFGLTKQSAVSDLMLGWQYIVFLMDWKTSMTGVVMDSRDSDITMNLIRHHSHVEDYVSLLVQRCSGDDLVSHMEIHMISSLIIKGYIETTFLCERGSREEAVFPDEALPTCEFLLLSFALQFKLQDITIHCFVLPKKKDNLSTTQRLTCCKSWHFKFEKVGLKRQHNQLRHKNGAEKLVWWFLFKDSNMNKQNQLVEGYYHKVKRIINVTLVKAFFQLVDSKRLWNKHGRQRVQVQQKKRKFLKSWRFKYKQRGHEQLDKKDKVQHKLFYNKNQNLPCHINSLSTSLRTNFSKGAGIDTFLMTKCRRKRPKEVKTFVD